MIGSERLEAERMRVASGHHRQLVGLGTLTLEEWLEILDLNDWLCIYCGEPFEHLEHVVAISLGGPHSAPNVAPACKPCNLEKGSKTPMEWVEALTERGIRIPDRFLPADEYLPVSTDDIASVEAGDELRSRRIAAGFTQEDLAQVARVSLRSVARAESGLAAKRTMERLSAALEESDNPPVAAGLTFRPKGLAVLLSLSEEQSARLGALLDSAGSLLVAP